MNNARCSCKLVLFLLSALVWAIVHVAMLNTHMEQREAITGSMRQLQALVVAARRLAAAHEDTLMLSFVSQERSIETRNFLALLREAQLLPNLLAIAFDGPSTALLQEHGVTAHILPSALRISNASNAATFGIELAARWRLLAALSRSGVRVWLCDVRTLWLRGTLTAATHLALPVRCDVAFAVSSPVLATADRSKGMLVASDPTPTTALSVFAPGDHVAMWQLQMADTFTEAAGAMAASVALLHDIERCGLREPVKDVIGASGNWTESASSKVGCPRLCTLPPRIFLNGVAAFQQPDAGEGAEAERGRSIQDGGGPTHFAIHADWPPSERYEYRLREARLWHATRDWQPKLSQQQLLPQHQPQPRQWPQNRQPRLPAQRGRLQLGGSARSASAHLAVERFIAFKELLINNGLSNARNALRSALAIAQITNRTLILVSPCSSNRTNRCCSAHAKLPPPSRPPQARGFGQPTLSKHWFVFRYRSFRSHRFGAGTCVGSRIASVWITTLISPGKHGLHLLSCSILPSVAPT